MALIQIVQATEPGRFATSNWIHYQMPDERWLLTLSGVVLVDYPGNSSGFRRDVIQIDVDTNDPFSMWPAPAPGYFWTFSMDQWAPFATINSIGASGTENAGYAVDSIDTPIPGVIDVSVAVRDSQAELWRVGYLGTWIYSLVANLTPG